MLSSFTRESCPKKKENILQLRRKQIIAEHGRFFNQNTCAMLGSLSAYTLQYLPLK